MGVEEEESLVKSNHRLDDTETTALLRNEHKDLIDGAEPIRTYWWRWTTLAIFVMNLGMFNCLWLTFAPIADVIQCYYNVGQFWVNSLSLVTMVMYVVLMFPSAWCLERFGLRTTTVLASCATALGAGLRLAGAGSGYFGVLLTGQTIASINNGLIWGAPGLLSEVWFPASERATATALGAAVSPQLGILAAFALSPVLVGRSDTNELCNVNNTDQLGRDTAQFADWSHTISYQLFYYLLGQAVLSLAILVLTLAAFRSAPPSPPSRSRQMAETTMHVESFGSTLAKFLKNKHYMFFLLAAGINVASSLATVSLINEIIHPYFPDYDDQIGYLGITAEVAAILVMVVVGRLLDTTKAFYGISLVGYIVSVLSMAGFVSTVLYQKHFWVIYIPVAFIGGGMTAYQAVAYEYAIEMTYPLPEGTAAGLLNFVAMLIAVVVIAAVGRVITYRVDIGVWVMVGIIVCGAVLAAFIRPKLRRVAVDAPKTNQKKMDRTDA